MRRSFFAAVGESIVENAAIEHWARSDAAAIMMWPAAIALQPSYYFGFDAVLEIRTCLPEKMQAPTGTTKPLQEQPLAQTQTQSPAQTEGLDFLAQTQPQQ